MYVRELRGGYAMNKWRVNVYEKHIGIVDHHGSSRGGHYTAQCRSVVTNDWYRYDDESVHPLGKPEFGESTYMMFLERN